MDRYLIRYFLAVVEAGTFSRAADRVNVTQPTLSVGIAKLERQLGAQLFQRAGRRVILTEAGSRFLRRARNIEYEFNQAALEVAGPQAPRLLRIGLLNTLPAEVVEDIVAAHRASDTPDQVEIIEGAARELTGLLDRGAVDIAVSVARPQDETLLSEGYALALPAWHRLAGQEAIRAEDLGEEPMIVRRNCEALSETSRHFTARGVRPVFSLRTNSDERALAMVRAGLGVTVMPAGYAAPGVVRPLLADFTHTRRVGLLYGERAEELREAPGSFIRAVRARLGA